MFIEKKEPMKQISGNAIAGKKLDLTNVALGAGISQGLNTLKKSVILLFFEIKNDKPIKE